MADLSTTNNGQPSLYSCTNDVHQIAKDTAGRSSSISDEEIPY